MAVLRTAWVFLQRALLAVGLLMLLGLAVLPHLGLYRPATVLSGSMRPTYSPGDMIIDVPEPVSAVRVGQIISYQVPTGIHQVESHRIVRILSGGAHPVVQTQGDANNWPDPWTAKLEGSTAWRQVAVLPHLGSIVNTLRGRTIKIAAVLLAPALLVALVLAEIWGVAGAGEQPGAPGENRERCERRVSRERYSGPERRVGGDRRIGRTRAPRPAPALQAASASS
ncbi:MAG TPA: signal peptidase I [Solirubrobacteraceae bacterium]|jgi:signal peptidase|nr:signal peptidase I [Solirubrobacteraceae bacterium]